MRVTVGRGGLSGLRGSPRAVLNGPALGPGADPTEAAAQEHVRGFDVFVGRVGDDLIDAWMLEGVCDKCPDDLGGIAATARPRNDGVAEFDDAAGRRTEKARAGDEGIPGARGMACDGIPGEPPDEGRTASREPGSEELLRIAVVFAGWPVGRNGGSEESLKVCVGFEFSPGVLKRGRDEIEALRSDEEFGRWHEDAEAT